LQGSYKFGTQVRPVRKGDEFDIDLGIYYCWPGIPDDGNFGPGQLKQFVRDELKEFERQNDDVVSVTLPKMRCERIRFKGDFHIDVPCYHLDADADRRDLATQDDEWEDSDPKALYEWFKDQFEHDQRPMVRRLVRYAKAWAALKFHEEAAGRPSSVLLTVMVANAVTNDLGLLGDEDDTALLCVLVDMLQNVRNGQTVLNPVDHDENLASRMTPEHWAVFANRLEQFVAVAEAAQAASDEMTACASWSVAFEFLFPLPEPEIVERVAKSLPVPILLPEIEVHAVSRSNPNVRYSGTNSIGPIVKDCDLTFKVANADHFLPGTEFSWMVRNNGEEAEDVNDLGHASGKGVEMHETSAYNGVHYMDCVATRNGRLTSVRRVKVAISSAAAPRRNPPKPAWTKLRGRR